MPNSIAPLTQAVAVSPSDPRLHFDLGWALLQCGRLSDAIASLQQAAVLKPDFTEAFYNLGIALQSLGHDEAAIGAFRRAISLNTKLTDAYNRMGCLLQMAGRERESAEAFRSGARAGGRTVLGRICEARLLALQGHFSESANVIRRALALEPGNCELVLVLGHLLTFAGDLDAAAAQYTRAIKLGGNETLPMTSLAQVRKITDGDRPLLNRMRDAVEHPGVPDLQRMELHFALGKCHDDLNEHGTAITHFDAANRIRNQFSEFHREPLVHLVDTIINQCSSGFFAERRATGDMDETPLFVLGMPRSGTTLVETILSSHPAVAGAGELTFWMDNASLMERDGPAGVDPDTLRRLAREYLHLLRSFSPDARRIIDKMPFSFLWLGLILVAFPNARVIHCQRHPVDTCLSIYFTSFQMRGGFFSNRSDLVFYYRQYQRLMQHWREVLPPERFMEIEYETLIAEQDPETRRLVSFCGIEWDDACLRPEQNRRVVKTASMWQARQPVYRSSVARWKRYEPWLGALRDLLAPEPAPLQAAAD